MDNTFRISSSAVSDRGLSDKRPENEDSYLEMPQSGIYAVADGVGGAQAGEVASQMAMEILGEAFTNLPAGADPEDVMRAAIERANAAIYEMAHELPQLSSMASTVVALHLAGNIATIAHVGDSRLYRVDANGELHRETDDHSMVAEEVRAGRMTEEEAETHPSRNIISRALGAEPMVEVDLKTLIVDPGTSFLICSDGITRHVGDQEIQGVLNFGGKPAEICEYLKSLCYERGAEDNLTAVVVALAKGDAATADVPASIVEPDETTIAAARSPFDKPISDDEIDGLLEIETQRFDAPDLDLDATQPFNPETPGSPNVEHPAVPEDVVQDVPPIGDTTGPSSAPTDAPFSMFGASDTDETKDETTSGAAKFIKAAGLLLLGAIIGAGALYLAFRPLDSGAPNPMLSEMKSENIPFTSFEKNRRNVDADPAAYLKAVPPAEDAEGFYLIGRANLLLGDFPKARTALVEAQKRVRESESANARILAADIATALHVTNDPTYSTRLKSEIDASLIGTSDASPAR